MKKRIVISCLMLFSYSILLGHNFIPHKHLEESNSISVDYSCKDHDKDHNHQCSCNMEACIAFNGVSFLKKNTYGIEDKIITINLLSDPLSKLAHDPSFNAEKYWNVPLRIELASQNHLRFISLRAPPV